jgi:uncharacterized protein
MIMPHRRLSPDALRGVIEAFVTREGTDYGVQDVPLAMKVFQMQQQLDAGTAGIVYDEHTESCTIQPADQLSGPPGPQAPPGVRMASLGTVGTTTPHRARGRCTPCVWAAISQRCVANAVPGKAVPGRGGHRRDAQRRSSVAYQRG